jgi:NAD-specific glutamate dehydrogenase
MTARRSCTSDSYPRDELFQIREEELYNIAIGILNLQERQRIALVRRDPLERFVTCPCRGTATTRNCGCASRRSWRRRLPADFSLQVDESVLARVEFLIGTTRGAVPAVDVVALEQRLAEAGRSWSDRVEAACEETYGEVEGRARLRRLQPFPVAYQARTTPAQAVADLERIEASLAGSPLGRCILWEGSETPLSPTGPATRLCSPRCCRSWKISGCASWPRNRSASRAPTAEQSDHEFVLAAGAACQHLADLRRRSRRLLAA